MSAYLCKMGIPARVGVGRWGQEVQVRGPGEMEVGGAWSMLPNLLGRLPGRDAWRELGRPPSSGQTQEWGRRLSEAGIGYQLYGQTVLVRPADFLSAREAVGEDEVDESYVLLFPESGRWRPYEKRAEKEGVRVLSVPGEGVYVRAVDQLRVLGLDNDAAHTIWSNHFFRFVPLARGVPVRWPGGLPVTLSPDEAEEAVLLLRGARMHAFRVGEAVYVRESCTDLPTDSAWLEYEFLLGSWVELQRRQKTPENAAK